MNLLLIDETLKSLETFIGGSNEMTRYITYGLEDSFEELKIKIQNLEVYSFNHVGFVFEYEDISNTFVSNNPFISFDELGIKENLTTQFIKELVSTYNVQTLDFLACDLLLNPTWKSYFEYLQLDNSNLNENNSLIVRASNNKSGNLQYGGDWILESTNEDVTTLYFNENIGEWSHLLGINNNNLNIILTNDETDNLYTCGALPLIDSFLLMRMNGHYTNSDYNFNKNIISCESTIDSVSFLTDETSNNLYILGRNLGNKFGFGNSLTALDISNIKINIQDKKVIQVCLPRAHVASLATSMYILTDESLNNLYSCGSSLLGLGATTTANTFQRVTSLNQKILMVTGTTDIIELITDETNNNIYYLNSTTSNLFVKRNDVNLMSKKAVYIERGQNSAVLTNETSNNLYVLGSNSSGKIGLGPSVTSVTSYTNVSTYSTNLLNKRVEKVYMNELISNSGALVLTDELSNNLYASGANSGDTNLHLGIGNIGINTFTKVSNYSIELLNKKVILVNFNSQSTSLVTDEVSNNLYSTGVFSTRTVGKPITSYNDIINGTIKTFVNVSLLSNELINKQVKIVTGYGYDTTGYFSCAITTENPSINSNIYVCGAINSTLMSINKSILKFKKIHPPTNKKFVKYEMTNKGVYALSNEASNNLYLCATSSPFAANVFYSLTNISLTQPQILGKKIINVSASSANDLVYVITNESSNNLYGCCSLGTLYIGNGTTNTYSSFININNNLVNKKVIHISCGGGGVKTLLTDETINNYYVSGPASSTGAYGNGSTTAIYNIFTKITHPNIINKKFIYSESVLGTRTYLISDETSNNLYACGSGYLGNNVSSSTQSSFLKITNNIQNKKVIKVSTGTSHNALITDETSFNKKILPIKTITIGTTNITINSIAYSPTLNRILAVGYSGSGGTTASCIIYSDDYGNNWSTLTFTGSSYNLKVLNNVIWSSSLSKYLICGNVNDTTYATNARIIHSSDGLTWSSYTLYDSNSITYKQNISNIIKSDELSIIYALSSTKIFKFNQSNNRFNEITISTGVNKIYWINEISKFIAFQINGSNFNILYSSNGTLWNTSVNTFSGSLSEITWSPTFNKLFGITSSNALITSSDGITWIQGSTNLSNLGFAGINTFNSLNNLNWNEKLKKFIAIGYFSSSSTNYFIIESSNCIEWNMYDNINSNVHYIDAIDNLNDLLVFYKSGSTTYCSLMQNYFSTNLYISGTTIANGYNGEILSNFRNVYNAELQNKRITDVYSGNNFTTVTTSDNSNNIYMVGTNTSGQLGVNDKINRTTFTLPYNLNVKSNVYVPPVVATSVPVVINAAPITTTDSSGNTVVSAPVKYAPKVVNIGNDNQIFFPDPTKTSIEIAPVQTTEAVQKYESVLNVTSKNVVSGYIKLEPAGTTFEKHISLEFDVEPFIQPVVYFKSSTDPAPVLIPSSNNSSNSVYYVSNTSTGAVTLYTKHFSEAIVTQDQSTLNPPLEFVLSKFNTSLEMGLSGELFKEAIPVMDVSGIAEYYVKTSDMRNVFAFQTDSRDINNLSSEDVKYFVRKNQWPQGLVLNPCHAWVQTSKQIASSDKSGLIPDDKQLVKHDFIRYIAKSMFNTHLGVDLFQNESELKYDLAYKGHNSAWTSIWNSITSISDVSLNTNTYSGLYGTDASYGYFLTNDLSNNSNICRQLLSQVISTAPGRMQDITSYAIDISSGLFAVPLMDGDSISFKLTLQTAPNQHLLLNSATPIQPRSYQIRVNLRDTVTRGTTHQNGTNLIVNDPLPDTYLGSVPTDNLNTSYPANYV